MGGEETIQSRLEEQAFLLRERVKELECLRGITRLFDQRDADTDEILQGVVGLLPAAWRYADAAGASIELEEVVFTTPGYRDTEWRQTAPVVVRGETIGRVTVSYLHQIPSGPEGPFLEEEQGLLDMVAQRLGGFIEIRRSMQSLLAYQEDLRQLASALYDTEQQERRRIAEGLHDNVGQNLALVSMRLNSVQRVLEGREDVETAAMVAEARESLSDVITETRTLTFDLCPPILYELGLAAALDWLAEQLEETHGIRVVALATRSSAVQEDIPEQVKSTLFRAAREILANVVRHARATTVSIELKETPEAVILTIEDNGSGFDTGILETYRGADRGFGLFNISERLRVMGGGLRLDSTTGRGTVAHMSIPRIVGGAAPAAAAPPSTESSQPEPEEEP